MHQCKIEHDERFLVRPWGVKCACGFSGAALDKKEAERIAKAHEEITTQECRQKFERYVPA
jgi:hypothetical protein